MSIERKIRRAFKKLKALIKKHQKLMGLIAVLLLIGVLLLGRYLDSTLGSAEEYEGETLPVETILVTEDQAQED